MKNGILTLFVLMSTCLGFGQIGVNLNAYDFKEIPTLSKEEDSLYEKKGKVILKESKIVDYHFTKEGYFELWHCNHIMAKLYSDEEVEQYKGIPINNISNMIAWKARTITKDGKVTEYSDLDIEEYEEENEDGEIKKSKILNIYALEKGAIIEYFFIFKSPLRYEDGYYLQSSILKKNVEFTLILPAHLKADVRSYNGLPDAIDTVIKNEERRFTYIFSPEIPGMNDDPISFYKANLQTVEYVIAYNLAHGKMRINTIDAYAQSVYNIVAQLDKSDINRIYKLGKKIEILKEMTEDEKIRKIENYVKENFYILNINGSGLSEIKSMLSTKLANTIGLTKLYYHLFEQFGIENEIVLTCDKTDNKFDKTFDATNFLNELLFYFPNTQQYLSVNMFAYRVGLTPSQFTGNAGAFFSKTTVGKTSTFISQIREIPLLPMKVTTDSICIKAQIDLNEKMLRGTLYRSLRGYTSFGFQANYPYYEIEVKENIVEHFIGLGSENTNINNEKIENATPEDVWIKPLVMTADISSYEYVKISHDVIVLNIGKLIGEQNELKQEEARMLPVEFPFRHLFQRTITIEIPEGYQCKDLANVNVTVYDTDDASTAQAGFVSIASQEGNNIVIHCSEYYNRLYYPVSEFTNYQKVNNAAAAFNEKRVTFTKK